jgi:hypothetical protein
MRCSERGWRYGSGFALNARKIFVNEKQPQDDVEKRTGWLRYISFTFRFGTNLKKHITFFVIGLRRWHCVDCGKLLEKTIDLPRPIATVSARRHRTRRSTPLVTVLRECCEVTRGVRLDPLPFVLLIIRYTKAEKELTCSPKTSPSISWLLRV